jgi:hypothetical protein
MQKVLSLPVCCAPLLPRKGGGLEDEGKDHFPQMNFRPKVALEHLV